MKSPWEKLQNIAVFLAALLLVAGLTAPAEASLSLTPEEKDYIDQATVLRAASIDGVAPFHYTDATGEINGINVRILQEIADTILSLPYLVSETILYINSTLDPTHLDDKIYAGLIGGSLPQGVKEENTLYYGTREQSLDAVEKGEADYGYGNAYSVAYYTLQNNYNNIVTIPR